MKTGSIKNVLCLAVVQLALAAVGCSQHAYTCTTAVPKVKKGKPFSYAIPSNLGSGRQWVLYDTTQVRVLVHTSTDNKGTQKELFPNVEHFRLVGVVKGATTLFFYNMRPFDNLSDTATANKLIQKIIIQ